MGMLELGGMIRAANGGKIITQRTNCATDTMSIGNAPSVPVVCGTLTGDHIYFDASDSCHNLMLNFGQWSNDNTIPTTRQVSIKVHKYILNLIYKNYPKPSDFVILA